MSRFGRGARGGRVESDDGGVVEADAFAEGCCGGVGGEGGEGEEGEDGECKDGEAHRGVFGNSGMKGPETNKRQKWAVGVRQ